MKLGKIIRWGIFIGFIITNIIAYNHAYQFTHFVDPNKYKRTKRPEHLSLLEKVKVLFGGISVPKPVNKNRPDTLFEVIYIEGEEKLETWLIPVPDQKGIVVLFHGYASSKSDLLPYAKEFNNKGYSTLLVDFRGNGGSTGYTTTIGYKEGEDVKLVLEYMQKRFPRERMILFGASMGAAAIMKSVEAYDIQADKIILECPFGSLLTTSKKRFEVMGVPSFPLAEILLFYGGIQTGFNPFKHEPTEYAKAIKIPTLLMYGAKDARVTRAETDTIFKNLAGPKELVIFERAAHEIYLNDHREDWNKMVEEFLSDE